MAEGMFVRVTHAGASDGSLLLSDINDATDGPAYGLTKAGAVYVPESGSVDLVYSGDVARSFESGAIRAAIDGGLATATFGHGDSVGQVMSFTFADGDVVACAALGKLIGVSLVLSGGADAGATLAIVDGDASAMVTAADANGAGAGATSMDVTDDAEDVSAGDVLTITWTDGAAQGATVQLTFAS